ncbi:hypothetical protein L599_002100000130 [Luteimonas sp. J16]|jgi:hypothetical protein|uniref:hypothetical protein n=1 Tax=unclassified Luteimonas TaxID=2629088 RepID=UPI000686A5B5|nr:MULTISPECIES: hypothetical protein [unclassified Luteimonas]TWG91810.1 hypothetical protein L599_002100000130 [Luteimonas sp. J16]
MNGKTVYAKTAAGQQEIGERKAGLDIRQRRLLILVDGHRSVDELRQVSGLQDALALLESLQAKGLVSPVAGAAPAPAPGPAPAAAAAASGPAPAAAAGGDLRDRRRRAAHAVNEMLGPMGEDLALRLEEAKSEDVLEQLLERARTVIGDVRGKAALARFEQLLVED